MARVQNYLLHSLADEMYYEGLHGLKDEATRYRLSQAEPPAGWARGTRGLWTLLRPSDLRLPEQGWKIHLSAVPAQAEATLETAARICLDHGVAFKFQRSAQALQVSSAKSMSRASSGKFVTVYPRDDRQFSTVLAELVEALDGRPGPYILSDLRIGRGPVYVRYGAFVDQWCSGPDGEPVLAVREPSGELVPDLRSAVFETPAWVRFPEVLEPHLAARGQAGTGEFPYTVQKVLHFSTSGGTYLAEHRDTGEQFVLREARPYSGIDAADDDAVARLHREYRMLHRLDGLDCVPKVYGIRSVWEHHFLIEEYVEGATLLQEMISRNPVPLDGPTPQALAEHAVWVAGVSDSLTKAVTALHERGVRFGDLHPSNVIVRPDGSVVLIDFEYADDLGSSRVPQAGAAGFIARGLTGAEADRYGLWAIWLAMLAPLTEMVGHDPAKAATVESWARAQFGLAPDAGPARPEAAGRFGGQSCSGRDEAAELFSRTAVDWPTIRDLLVAGIHAGATPERTDRLFPGDPEVFETGGFTLAHGAAGVLLALHRTGVPVPPEYTDWLAAAARRARPGPGRGLYDGLLGAATALHELGRADDALELLARLDAVEPPAVAGLLAGQAGVALSRCRFAAVTGDDSLLEAAVRTAQRLDELVREGRADGLVMPGSAGLMHGLSGAALLQLRLHGLTGEPGHLAAARRALERELAHTVPMADGTRQVKDGNRHLLYLDKGSSGIALVAHEYLARTEDPELARFVAAVRRGCGQEFVREPGLFGGRAGLVAVLRRLGSPETGKKLLRSVRMLSLQTVYRDDALYVPGRFLLRFSADLATGSAGVLLGLHAALATGEADSDFLTLLPTC